MIIMPAIILFRPILSCGKVQTWLAEKFEYTSTPEFMYQLNRKHNQTNCLTPYLAYGINAFENGVMGPNYELKKYFSPYFFNFETGDMG